MTLSHVYMISQGSASHVYMIYKIAALCYTDHMGRPFPLRIHPAPVLPGLPLRDARAERVASEAARSRTGPAGRRHSLTQSAGASPARTIARRRSSADRGRGCRGRTRSHAGPGRRGRTGITALFHQIGAVCHLQKGSPPQRRQGPRKGCRSVNSPTGFPGGVHPESTAKPCADVDGAGGESFVHKEVFIMPMTDSQLKANRKWDSANYTALACKPRKEVAGKFRENCRATGTTPNAVLVSTVELFNLDPEGFRTVQDLAKPFLEACEVLKLSPAAVLQSAMESTIAQHSAGEAEKS